MGKICRTVVICKHGLWVPVATSLVSVALCALGEDWFQCVYRNAFLSCTEMFSFLYERKKLGIEQGREERVCSILGCCAKNLLQLSQMVPTGSGKGRVMTSISPACWR